MTAWQDPRGLVPKAHRSEVDSDRGLAALFDLLARQGPARVPDREEAARIAGCSLATLKRHFPLVAGRPWHGFIRRWRVFCARHVIKDPFASVKGAARACGFRSTAALSRAFRLELGMTPRAFRAARRRRRRFGRVGAGVEE